MGLAEEHRGREMVGTLYVVATPIGNLEDVTLRALRMLGEANLILCEDTRVTKKLLARHGIRTPLERFDAVVEGEKTERVLALLGEGKRLALVSDAGTPAVSDPGARLAHAARAAGYAVLAVPGPSSVTAALSVAGVPADSFTFLGFPPHKKGRKTFFERLTQERGTVVFFESTHRILKALASLAEVAPEREVVLASELSKLHEEVLTGTAIELLAMLEEHPEKQKGEFVIVLAPESKR